MRSVLLLDDEPAVLSVLSDYLTAPGLEIITCEEIEAAEAMLTVKHFDVVVTDLHVSEIGGLEGMRLIRYVATNFPKTIVLAMSGFVNDDVHALGRAVGATAILEKPIDLRRLLKYVHTDEQRGQEGEGPISNIGRLDEFLERGEIAAMLQPIVRLHPVDGQYVAHAYESLARAPMGTPLRNPEVLFAYAARKERLFDTDLLCIKAALREARELGDARGNSKLFINTQPRSMTAPDFASVVTDLIHEAGFRRSEIVFELTEQQTIVNPTAFAATLGTLRSDGFAIALDDYGVGFANLRLVQDLRPEYVKLSGYFCQGIDTDPYKQLLVRSTAEMCERVNIPTILENVETESELEVVRDLGVTYGQGYFFARPAPAQDLVRGAKFRAPGSVL